MMEFNGYTNMDFDFFRKKDKLLKTDYDSARNNLRLHFRGMCYGLQKLYYKNVGEVFTLEREYQNFNKRSTSINASHIIKDGDTSLRLNLELDNNGLFVEIVIPEEVAKSWGGYVEYLKANKQQILNYVMGNRFRICYAEVGKKVKDLSIIKVSGFEISDKNYDNFIKNLENSLKAGNTIGKLCVGYFYNKGESTKQGTELLDVVYDSITSLKNTYTNFIKSP